MSPGAIYIESDLPQLMIRKAKMVRNSLMSNASENRSMLHYCATDVLNRDSLLEALNSIDTYMPFTIVTEGLLLYFTNEELRLFLQNMVTLLSRGRNAIWITDLVTQENLNELFASHPGVSRSVRKVFELTGRTIKASNPFQSNACVERYVHEFGLRVDRTVSLRDVAPRLNLGIPIDSQLRENIVGSRKIWTFRLTHIAQDGATLTAVSSGADWPQWGGTNARLNTPVGRNIPTQWSVGELQEGDRKEAQKPIGSQNIKWAVKLGSETFGNPVVAGGKVFIGTNNGAGFLDC